MNAKHVPITKEQVAASLPEGVLDKIHDFMTTREAAEAWGMRMNTVENMINRGAMPWARKVGGTWVIPLTAPRPVKRGGRYVFTEDEDD